MLVNVKPLYKAGRGFQEVGGRGLHTHTSVFHFAPYAFSTLVLSDSRRLGDAQAVHSRIKAS